MGIVRHDPVKNLDTEQILNIDQRQRVTRSTLHRILKKYGIKHDARSSLNMMLDILNMNNIPFDVVPPGPVTDTNGNIIDFEPKDPIHNPLLDFAEDGFPKHIGKIKKMCKDRGIKFTNKGSTRKDLVEKLNEYMNHG